MDVKSTYLNATIDKEIYVEKAKGFQKSDESGKKLFLQIKEIPLWFETKWLKLETNIELTFNGFGFLSIT